MIQINDSLLNELGLGSLPTEERKNLLNHIYETLELRVGMRLADQMTNQQLDEFEKYFEAKDDKGAFNWLETNFPNYKDIVQEEFDKLKTEVAQSAPQILIAAQNNQADYQANNSINQPLNPNNQTNLQQPPLNQQPYPPAPGINNTGNQPPFSEPSSPNTPFQQPTQ